MIERSEPSHCYIRQIQCYPNLHNLNPIVRSWHDSSFSPRSKQHASGTDSMRYAHYRPTNLPSMLVSTLQSLTPPLLLPYPALLQTARRNVVLQFVKVAQITPRGNLIGRETSSAHSPERLRNSLSGLVAGHIHSIEYYPSTRPGSASLPHEHTLQTPLMQRSRHPQDSYLTKNGVLSPLYHEDSWAST